MNRKIFLNRRSGTDRRQLYNSAYDSRRVMDRRQIPNNDLALIIGSDGLDRFELMAIVPILALMSAVMLGAYFSSF
ncbi:hypothetical protein [Oceanicoccus sagamiensis]|uniref:Uncharacterized protein n=1 Tax=Oceanicoccus sagamiensis TaxID=716816 RepID=A0A1X9NDD8_9GAMM|nr:hypothetical protein [Oceanicoccus sagamiensis]ARN73915.1 hypothetical protein BST96_07175 [Oceanicoccus sagamiensis]